VPCDSGPATDIGVLMGKCMVPRYGKWDKYREERQETSNGGRG
jgi:hypothetical protein